MRIWVDADACPNAIKEILVRAAERTHIAMTLVAGQPVQAPRSRWVTAVTVATGFDAADDAIIERMSAGDLVVTGRHPAGGARRREGRHCARIRAVSSTPWRTSANGWRCAI